MKIQTLYKRLSMPVLFTVICVTGIGVSTPARSASLLGSQSMTIDAKPEAILIAQRCPYGMKPEFDPPCHSSAGNMERSSEDSSKDPRYQHPRQQQRKLEIQRQQQQRELEIQRQQQQRELQQQQPTPQN